MTPLIEECDSPHTPESLVESLAGEPGVALLQGGLGADSRSRYAIVTARPFLTFRTFGVQCQIVIGGEIHMHFGNPWQILGACLSRYELLDQIDLPFPLGGCFGYWGFDLKNFIEPRLPQRALNDLELPDCHLGFYSSLVVFDRDLATAWIVSTGLTPDGSRSRSVAREHSDFWRGRLASLTPTGSVPAEERTPFQKKSVRIGSNLSRSQFIDCVERAQRYIHTGDIYQVNLSQRFEARFESSSWNLYRRLAAVSPAPFAAYLDLGDFEIASSSPELFLRLSGNRVLTRPIKGTRPRSADPTEDTQLAYELQTSPKELAELVMITDLLRNDLGKFCEFGSIHVPELVRLERFAHVQHLVSTVEGHLQSEMTHWAALASCFPGGSITGAPKIRAMEIIDELEPVARGPYTGALGYLGFNRESQLSILIRAAVCRSGTAYFHVGAGIVADSLPEAEFDETVAKARGFFDALAAPGFAPVTRTSRAAARPGNTRPMC